jgi:hypothetical protein
LTSIFQFKQIVLRHVYGVGSLLRLFAPEQRDRHWLSRGRSSTLQTDLRSVPPQTGE